MSAGTAYSRALQKMIALIAPRIASTEAETAALEEAARAQEAFEETLPEGLRGAGHSNDGFSVSGERASLPAGISPAAKAILKNAGLLKSGFPTAKPM